MHLNLCVMVIVKNLLLAIVMLLMQGMTALALPLKGVKHVEVSSQFQLDTLKADVPLSLSIKCTKKWKEITIPDSLLYSANIQSIHFAKFSSEFNELRISNPDLLKNSDVSFAARPRFEYKKGERVSIVPDFNDTNYYSLHLDILSKCKVLRISGYDSLSLMKILECEYVSISISNYHVFLDSSVFKGLRFRSNCGLIQMYCSDDSADNVLDANWLNYISLLQGNLIANSFLDYLRPLDLSSDSSNQEGKVLCAGFELYTNNSLNFDRFFNALVPEFLRDTTLCFLYFKTDVAKLTLLFEKSQAAKHTRNFPLSVSVFLSHTPDYITSYLLSEKTQPIKLYLVSFKAFPLDYLKKLKSNCPDATLVIHESNCSNAYKRSLKRHFANKKCALRVYCSRDHFVEFNNLEY